MDRQTHRQIHSRNLNIFNELTSAEFISRYPGGYFALLDVLL